MSDFEKWFEQHSVELFGPITQADAEKLYLAGQASAEQRVKWQDDLIQELQAKCAELERERDQWKYTAEIRQQHLEYTIKAQAGEPVGYHFSYTTPFGHVVWAIDYTPRPDAIEVYPLVRAHPTTERPYNPLNDYAVISMNPTEPVKAQAGEPVAWMKTNGGNGNEKVFISAHMKQRGYDDFDVPLFTHPTTERRVMDGLPMVISGAIFDFAGYLTTRPEAIAVGATAEAAPVCDLVKEWAELRGLSLDDAAVLSWQEALRNALNAAPTPTKD